MSNRGKDFTGQKIGMLTVIKRLDQRDKHRNIMWLCKCDCGNESIVPTSRFACAPEIKISCGCQRTKLEDLTGKRFGRWTVISKADSTSDWRTRWNCICDCGTKAVVQGGNLRNGKSVSCGCYKKEVTSEISKTHGDSYGVRLYRIWMGMRQRCNNPNSVKYPIYGGRGIKVCDDWNQSYPSFKEWALSHGYAEGLTIDRIDNDKGYSPDNCRWISNKEQCNHKRNNVRITYNGETKGVPEWAKELSINARTVYERKRYGWSDEECLFGRKLTDAKIGDEHEPKQPGA